MQCRSSISCLGRDSLHCRTSLHFECALLSDRNNKVIYSLSTNVRTSDRDLLHLVCRYGAVDVLVQPSRGEGWGLPMVEAMACGTPVIGTRWSGPAEFLTEENGYPLRTDGLVPNHGAVCTPLAPTVLILLQYYNHLAPAYDDEVHWHTLAHSLSRARSLSLSLSLVPGFVLRPLSSRERPRPSD